jgi:hypothetical protein
MVIVLERLKADTSIRGSRCCIKCEFEEVNLKDIAAAKLIPVRKSITTSTGIFDVGIQSDTLLTTRQKTFKIEWLCQDMPIRGTFLLLKLRMSKYDNKINRNDIITKMLKFERSLLVSTIIEDIKRDTKLDKLIEGYINRAIKTNKSLIIMSTDKVGSVLKTYTNPIYINGTPRIKVIIPDTILYNAIRSKVKIITSDFDKIETTGVVNNRKFDQAKRRYESLSNKQQIGAEMKVTMSFIVVTISLVLLLTSVALIYGNLLYGAYKLASMVAKLINTYTISMIGSKSILTMMKVVMLKISMAVMMIMIISILIGAVYIAKRVIARVLEIKSVKYHLKTLMKLVNIK